MAIDYEQVLDEVLIDESARIAERLYTALEGEPRCAVARGCAMLAAILIAEQIPSGPEVDRRELARLDMARVRLFLDEMLKSLEALRTENPYARQH